MNTNKKFKIVIIGDSHVGKSSLLMKYVDKFFEDVFITTIGVDFRIKKININNELFTFQIWDTSGQEKFRSLTKLYYRNCSGVLLVFDLSDKKSFINIEFWLKDIQKYCEDPNVSKLLIGNKIDLKTQSQVSSEEINKFCLKYNLTYIETSVKENKNIENCFIELGKKILKENETLYNIKNNIKLSDQKNKKNFCNGKC